MGSGLILFTYIGAHLLNHVLGLISLDVAEAGMGIAVDVWYSVIGTVLLYGAAAIHFMMALWAVYERRTFFLPPAELIRIALGFTLPILLIGHAASTRIAYEVLELSSDYSRVVSNLWATGSQGWQLGLMAPGWLPVSCMPQTILQFFHVDVVIGIYAELARDVHGFGCDLPGREPQRRRERSRGNRLPVQGKQRSHSGRRQVFRGHAEHAVRALLERDVFGLGGGPPQGQHGDLADEPVALARSLDVHDAVERLVD